MRKENQEGKIKEFVQLLMLSAVVTAPLKFVVPIKEEVREPVVVDNRGCVVELIAPVVVVEPIDPVVVADPTDAAVPVDPLVAVGIPVVPVEEIVVTLGK